MTPEGNEREGERKERSPARRVAHGDLPFVAREEEVRLVRACLDDPDVPGIVVTGGPGVGKSRLVQEAMDAPDAAGSRALWAVATSAAASIPFGSVAHLIPDVERVSETDRFSLFNAVASSLTERGNGGRLALVVDDAHLLDPAGAALVYHVANVRAAFVCAVVRDGETIPDAVRGLWKDVGATRLELEPLSHDAAAELIERILGGQVDEASKKALGAAAGGNVLVLREIVAACLEEGSLRTMDDGEIADRLTVSVRTVEWRLQQVYGKLGIAVGMSSTR